MKNAVNDKLTTYGLMFDFMLVPANKALISAVTEAAGDVTRFNTTLPLLMEAARVQNRLNSGLKDESDDSKINLGKGMVKYSKKTRALAKNAGKLGIYKQVKQPYSYYTKCAMNVTIERAQNFRDVLDANKGAGALFPNIEAADITAIDALISDFQSKFKVPKATRKDDKALGTDKVPGYVKIMDETMKNIVDFMYGEYIDTNPTFVERIQLAAKVDHTAIRHTGLMLFAVYAVLPVGVTNAALKGIQAKLVEPNSIATTNLFGLAGLSGVMPGTYTLEVSGTGFVTQSFVVTLKKGRMLTLEVAMVAV